MSGLYNPVLQEHDPESFQLIKNEELRESNKIRLIASENYVSAVLAATGSVLAHKYPEGYANKCYTRGSR